MQCYMLISSSLKVDDNGWCVDLCIGGMHILRCYRWLWYCYYFSVEGCWWWSTCWPFAFHMPNYYHEPLLFITCVGTAVVVVNMCYYFSWCVDDSTIDDVDGIPSELTHIPMFLSPLNNLMCLIIAWIIIWCVLCF